MEDRRPLHQCMMSCGPEKYQWSQRGMKTEGDGSRGEGCPHYIPGRGSWVALLSQNQGHGEGFQSTASDRLRKDSGEKDPSQRAHRVPAVSERWATGLAKAWGCAEKLDLDKDDSHCDEESRVGGLGEDENFSEQDRT
eukprot:12165475-Heterocapsa_arctica.AAC.1